MRRVAIKSPYSGNKEKNLRYLNACIKDALYRGEAPFATDKMSLDIANDEDPYENRTWQEAALDWEALADYIVVYMDLGITPEMSTSVKYHQAHGAQIIYRTLSADILFRCGLDLPASEEYLQQEMAFVLGSTHEEDARQASGASP
jgi:hypothetical protein